MHKESWRLFNLQSTAGTSTEVPKAPGTDEVMDTPNEVKDTPSEVKDTPRKTTQKNDKDMQKLETARTSRDGGGGGSKTNDPPPLVNLYTRC